MLQRIMLMGVLVASLLGVMLNNVQVAHADLGCSVYSGQGSCSQFPDLGGDSFWPMGPFGASSLSNAKMLDSFRSLSMVGTGDNLKYALFGQEIELDPDYLNSVYLWNPGVGNPDKSTNGDNSTIQTRLWDKQTRYSSCPNGGFCDQRNYNQLEINSERCDPNGSTTSLGVTGTAGALGINANVTQPLYYGCLEVPVSDYWSQYYDYSLQDNNQQYSKSVQTFVFSQFKPYDWLGTPSNINHQFRIGMSVKSKWLCYCTYPVTLSSGDWGDDYNY